MKYTLEYMKTQPKPGYVEMWRSIFPGYQAHGAPKRDIKGEIKSALDRIFRNKERYVKCGKDHGIPWIFIGALHYREGNCNFSTHLHNGDPGGLNPDGLFTKRTVNVPKNRPEKLPCSWEESALDALISHGFGRDQALRAPDGHIDWSIWAMLWRAEIIWNGSGYAQRNRRSGYLWDGSNWEPQGRFVSDGKFDPFAYSKQIGFATILKASGIFIPE